MSIIGKKIRMERIINRETGRTIIVPMDHGITVGPIDGIKDMREIVRKVALGGANAIVEHKGVVKDGYRGEGPDIGLIVHLSASTALSPHPNSKTLVCTVEEAIKLGADAVSVHVNIGNGDEAQMLNDFGKISRIAGEWGMPLLAMIYPRGEKVPDEYNKDAIKHTARIGAEMGADLVKVSYPGTKEAFYEVVEGCAVPVVIAGGAKMDSAREILTMVRDSIDAGGAGVSIGRNVFQHDNPERIVKAMDAIIHQDQSVDKALEILERGIS